MENKSFPSKAQHGSRAVAPRHLSNLADSSFYLNLAKQIKESEDVTRLFEANAYRDRLINGEMLGELLHDLTAFFGCNLESAASYFSSKVNTDDPKDIVLATDMTELMLRRRLSNYCLTQACRLSPDKATPKQFISEFRSPKPRETVPKLELNPIVLASKADQIETQSKMPPYVKGNSAQQRNSSPTKTAEVAKTIAKENSKVSQPILVEASVPTQPPKESASLVASQPSSTWLSPYLETHSAHITEFFLAVSVGQEVSRAEALKVFTEVVKVSGIPRTSAGRKLFQSLIANYQKDTLTFSELCGLLNEWASQHTPEAVDITTKIKISIIDYEALLAKLEPGDSYDTLAGMIHHLKGQLRLLAERESPKLKSCSKDQQQAKSLSEIFAFYAKQQKIIGSDATFDGIVQSSSVWTLGKYFKFCTDFDLMGKGRGLRYLGKDDLAMIFKRNAEHAKLLREERFLGTLEQVAELYFNEDYDRSSGKPPVSHVGVKMKLEMMLLFLNLGNPELYQRRLKGFVHAFSTEKAGYRLPEGDLSKRYKYRDIRRLSNPADLPRAKGGCIQSTSPVVLSMALPMPQKQVLLPSLPSIQPLDYAAWKLLGSMKPRELGELGVLKALGIDESDSEETEIQMTDGYEETMPHPTPFHSNKKPIAKKH